MNNCVGVGFGVVKGGFGNDVWWFFARACPHPWGQPGPYHKVLHHRKQSRERPVYTRVETRILASTQMPLFSTDTAFFHNVNRLRTRSPTFVENHVQWQILTPKN